MVCDGLAVKQVQFSLVPVLSPNLEASDGMAVSARGLAASASSALWIWL